jgi:hypothetical protein
MSRRRFKRTRRKGKLMCILQQSKLKHDQNSKLLRSPRCIRSHSCRKPRSLQRVSSVLPCPSLNPFTPNRMPEIFSDFPHPYRPSQMGRYVADASNSLVCCIAEEDAPPNPWDLLSLCLCHSACRRTHAHFQIYLVVRGTSVFMLWSSSTSSSGTLSPFVPCRISLRNLTLKAPDAI